MCAAQYGLLSVLGELLSCERELDNAEDRYVVAVCKVNGIIVGHIPD